MGKEVWIGMSRAKLEAELTRMLTEVQVVPSGQDVDVRIDGEMNNASGEEVQIVFSSDDMERPEVADKTLVDLEQH